MSRERLRLLAGLAVIVVAVVVLWYWAESRRRAQENKAYWVSEANQRMEGVEWAVKRYYVDHGVWPENNDLTLVVPYLEQGRHGLLDPWGNPFTLQIVPQQHGIFEGRPVIACRTPNGEEIRYPPWVR